MAVSRRSCCSRSTSSRCGSSVAPPACRPRAERSATPEAPLILTLAFAGEAQDRFERLRRAHFPTALNQVPAHVTLFHALPGDAEAELVARLPALVGGSPFTVCVSGVRLLGRGVAFSLSSDELARRRAAVEALFPDRLTRQDRQAFAPHVTVQNKVSPAEARALHAVLAAEFVPAPIEAASFHLWRYLGGPWEPRARIDLCKA